MKIKKICPACRERDSRKGQFTVIWREETAKVRCAAELPRGKECGEPLIEDP